MFFENVGPKIKLMGKICWVICIIDGIISGIALIGLNQPLLAILAIVSFPISGLIFRLFMCGFGELVENSEEIKNSIKKMNDSTRQLDAKAEKKPQTPVAGEWQCSCGQINKNYISSCQCGKNRRDVLAEQNNV